MPLPAIIANNLLPLGALAPIGPAPGVPAAAISGAPAGGSGSGSLAPPFAMQPQEQSNWCWSAVSVSVAQFYNAATPWSQQCNLASQELTQVCCPAGTNSAVCDIPWYLDRARNHGWPFQYLGRRSAGDAGHSGRDQRQPTLGVRIGWSGGGGHFVVLCDYSSTTAGNFITVDDPFFAQSTLALSVFQSSYQGSGSWTDTYWTH